ncbi:MAG TPA: hypothetical protein VHS99_02035 [Chloroflexota bacterium]|jgi:hypothetical protein|nr:hypothetical protein [Chloroflexota bacterium]
MSTVEPDAGELLVKALDLAVGGVALARYAATHTADARLRRIFKQLAMASEHQEKLLRRYLVAHASGATQPARRRMVAYGAVGAASLAALLAGVAIAARLAGAGTAGPARRLVRGLGGATRRLFPGTDGLAPAMAPAPAS